MSASQILLAGHGQEDQWLSDNPNRTYFEAKYNPRVNRSRETYEIPFDNQDATFGSTGRCTIPVKGDYMTRMTLRAVMPPIYPTVPGQYVFPTPSSEVGATVYVNKELTLVVADGVTLTANTVGNHYFSIGAQVTLAGTSYVIFNLDGTYTITGIPTANSFTCSTTLAGISYNGTVSTPGIQCGDIISYFSTTNSNLWVNNVTNKTWQITGGTFVGPTATFTTSAPSNFPVGSQVILNLPDSGVVNQTFTVTASTDTTFTCTIGGRFYMNTEYRQAYSTDYGLSWTSVLVSSPGLPYWSGTGYGNGVFVGVSSGVSGVRYVAYSTDNAFSWTSIVFTPTNSNYNWYGVAFGNGVFVIVGNFNQGRSIDNGVTWTNIASPLSLYLYTVAFGNGAFVAVGYESQARSTDDGVTWTPVASPLAGDWQTVEFGNSVFVMVGNGGLQARSIDDGVTWTPVASPLAGEWYGVAFGNDVFVMVGTDVQARSIDNGITWNYVTNPKPGRLWGERKGVVFGEFSYVNSASNSVSLVTPELQVSNRVFSSDVYPSISFANTADAAFWGFDSREGLTYALPATPPWTLTQSGWISGFLPPSTSTYDDSVAHKLCKDVRVLVGKQTIKEYSGEYIELQNDLLVPYENKAILKLMNGTLDQTQATVSREYYVNLPLGTKEVPLCALTHQHMSVEVDFESYQNVSQNLNAGTGEFLDVKSYTTYDASTGLLNGQPINVQTTFSYQQYIFIVTYGGQFIIFDTTKNVDDPASYIVLSAFSGSSLFSQFCVLSGNLYIGLADGQLVRGLIDELIQGNISSLELNSYTPTVGSLTGTIVADFRYVYYTVSNTVTSNVFVSRYDTTGTFTAPGSYTTVDFTLNFNSNVTGVYQTLSTGTELIMIPQGTTDKLYTYQLNANVESQWYTLDYSSYGFQITEGVVTGDDTVYFVIDKYSILKYSNSTFSVFNYFGPVIASPKYYSLTNGKSWTSVTDPAGPWYRTTFGNGVFVAVGENCQAYSTDNGLTWTSVASPLPGFWYGVTYGNEVFVMVGKVPGGPFGSFLSCQAYSTDNGQTWINTPTTGIYEFQGVAFGGGKFIAVGFDVQAYSDDNGQTWYTNTYETGIWHSVTYGDGVFVMVGGFAGIFSGIARAYSTDFGGSWNFPGDAYLLGLNDVAYGGNGVFVAVGSIQNQVYSTDYGVSWTVPLVLIPQELNSIAFENGFFVATGPAVTAYSIDNGASWDILPDPLSIGPIAASDDTLPGDSLRNLIAVGNYIYCSTNNVAIQIDTSQDLSTAAAYNFPAPLPTNQYVFANGPRYVYMFAQGDNTAKNIVEFDPYGPDTTFKASILVDYESLPEGVKKPDKALLGLIQTQKVTDMTQMNIKGPVKELWVTGPSATTNVFQYSNLATQSTLELAGEQIVTDDVGTHTFFNVIEPFEAHTAMPIRNFSVLPFEFDPESEIPNGTVNFSRIRDQIFDGGAETVWARSYNLFAIQGGIGNLMYN